MSDIKLVYGDTIISDKDLLFNEKEIHRSFYNGFLVNSKTRWVIENSILKLSKKDLIWIISNTKRPVTIVLKNKKIKFNNNEIKHLKKIQPIKLDVKIIDNSEKSENIFSYLDRIAFDIDRKKLYNDLINKKIATEPLVMRMLLFPDKLKNRDTLLLLDKILFKTSKIIPAILSFYFKPIKKIRINWWSRK